jgi:TolB-like protein/DNA-binding SARP family transcriptional activator/cytochrome c-type biogenesis protein CcmH/NrfG
MIRIHTLGGLRVECDGEEVADLAGAPVRCALLTYLAVERSATRGELAALLWPDREPERARQSLRQTLYEVKRSLGEEWVEWNGERAAVGPAVGTDVQSFEAAVESGRDEAALALYGGAFLAGFDPGISDPYSDWVDRRRLQLSRRFRELCRRLTATWVEAGQVELALEAARRWAEADPLEDEAQHCLIELLAATGRRSDALRQYAEYEALLARELELEPLEPTKALVARLRASSRPAAAAATTPARWGSMTAEPMEERPPELARIPARRRTRRGLRLAAVAGAAAAALYLAAGRAGVPTERTAPASAAEGSGGLVVLPFANMSADPDQEYLADGVTEDLLTSVSRLPGLRVISRTSAWLYKGGGVPVPEIARALDVTWVLEGSVRRDGDRVRITAQLIDARTDSHVWAEAYEADVPVAGLFEVQREISERIADALAQRLPTAASQSAPDPLAHDLFLRGREYLNRPGDADLRKYEPAMAFFRQAIAAEPGHAGALVGMSEIFRRNPAVPPGAGRDSALHYARLAVAADPELAAAAAALGAALAVAGRPDEARSSFRRALALDGSHAGALAGLARLAAVAGRLDEAVRWQRQAVHVDPVAAHRHAVLGEYLFDLGDLDGAGQAFERAVAWAPDFPDARFLLAQVLLLRGDTAAADAQMDVLPATAGDHPATHMLSGRYLVQRGRHAEAAAHFQRSPGLGAAAIFRALLIRRTEGPEAAAALLAPARAWMRGIEQEGRAMPPRARLYIHALSGDVDAALATIREHGFNGLRYSDVDPPEIGVYFLDSEPLLADVPADPRFPALLADLRLSLDSMRVLAAR